MPVNVVHSKSDESKWEAAKKLARRSYPSKTGASKWRVVMHIFQNQKAAGKTAHVGKSASATELILYRGFVLEKSRFEELMVKAISHGFRVRPLGDSLASQRGLELQQYSKDIRPHRSRLGKPPTTPAAKKPKLPALPKSFRTVVGTVLR